MPVAAIHFSKARTSSALGMSREDFLKLILTFVVDVNGGIEVRTFVDGLTGVFNFRFIHCGVVGEYVVE